MKKSLPLLLVLLISLGCGPSIKTKRLAIEPAAARGQIAITIKPAEGIEATDVSRMRYLLQESFAAAGYGKVSVNSGGNPSSRTVKILLTRFEHESSSNNTKMATGIGCACGRGRCTCSQRGGALPDSRECAAQNAFGRSGRHRYIWQLHSPRKEIHRCGRRLVSLTIWRKQKDGAVG